MSIAEHRMTCFACPTQAEGTLDDGHHFYFRYRWGVASLSTSRSDHIGHSDSDGYAEQRIGDPLDGFLSEAQALVLIVQLAEEIDAAEDAP